MKSSVVGHIVFDFFGTLVGYNAEYVSKGEYFNTHKFLIDKGYAVNYKQFVVSFSEEFQLLEKRAKATNKEFSMFELAKAFFEKNLGKAPGKVLKEFIEIYITEWNRQILYNPKMKSFLKKLQKHYSLSIITNTHYKPLIDRHLEAMDVSDCFKLVLTSVEYGIPKPDPRIFHEAIRRLLTTPEAVVYIGNNYNDDYQGALSAGIRCILIDPDKKWQGVVKDRVDNLFEIEKLLK